MIVKDFYFVDWETSVQTPANFPYNYDSQSRTLTVMAGEFGSRKGGKFTIEGKLKNSAPQGAIITNYATVYFPTALEETKTNSIVSIVPKTTQIHYSGFNTVQYSDYALLRSTVSSEDKLLAGKIIDFTIDSIKYSAITDTIGVGQRVAPILLLPGQYVFKAEFPGDGYYYLPSEFNGIFTVEKENTVLSKPNFEIEYSSIIAINISMNDDEDEEILNQLDEPKTVYLEYKDSGTYKIIGQTVLSSGTAHFEFELPEPFKRAYELRARFDGDEYYEAAISTGTLNVVDRTPPEISIISPKVGEKYAGVTPIKIEYSVIDNLDPNPTLYAFLTYLAGDTTRQVLNGEEIMPLDVEAGYWIMTVQASDIDNNISSFTTGEFEILHDILPPRTTAEILGDIYQAEDGTFYITSNTSFTLTSIDDLINTGDEEGLGVKQISVRVKGIEANIEKEIIFENENPESGKPFISIFTLNSVHNFSDGFYDLIYNSQDIAENIESTQTLKIAIDNTLPICIINSPKAQLKGVDKVFNKELSINISVSDEYLKDYKLEIAEGENAEGDFSLLHESTSSVNNAEVYILNAEDYSSGYYSLKLSAQDFAGNESVSISNIYIGKPQAELIIEGLNKPAGVAVDRLSNIYISDTQKNRILKLNQNGEILARFDGKSFNSKKGLKNPSGIAVDDNFDIYIADRDNHRLVVMNQYGTIIRVIGKSNPKGEFIPGNNENELHSPTSVAVSNDRIIVADKNAIKIFDKNTNFLFEIMDNGKVKYFDIAIDAQENIYATDIKNNKVLIYDKNGNLLKTINNLKEPKGIDTTEYIYAADRKDRKILKYNINGELLLEFDLKHPYALILDKESNLYATDREKSKFYKFVLNPNVSDITIKLKNEEKHKETKKERIENKNGRIFVKAQLGEIVRIKVYDLQGNEIGFKEFSAPEHVRGVFKYTYSFKETSVSKCEIKLISGSDLIDFREFQNCSVINIELK